MLNMRPKKKESTAVGNRGRDINQNNGNCKDYRRKLEEYRKGLYNLNRPENCQHSECRGECSECRERRCEVCETNLENSMSCEMSRETNHDCPRRDVKDSERGRGFRDSQFIRNSMHWEEFFGSSLELAPSLLSIFDSIASGNRNPDQNETDQSDQPHNSSSVDPSNEKQAQELPTIKVDAENCNHSNTMDPCRNDLDTNDNKKRPLSISSMSSTSSSSLPRHTNKRPNLTGKNSNNSLQEHMENKLDNILYIDDDVPNGVTDDEMSVDTDCENNKKCEQETSSSCRQSDKSLSSNDNLSKSEDIRQPLAEVISNDLELNSRNEDSMNISSYCNGSSAASTPGSSFYETPNTSTSSISSPALQGQGSNPSSGTPSRQSSLRDSTSPQKYVSRVQRVVAEIVDTERTYVTHLKEIIEGYMKFLVSSNQQCISKKETACLFGNIEEIYEFSRHFSEELDLCEDDPAKIAQCFVRNNEGFAIYTNYCTNYPSAVEVLTKVMKDPVLSEQFKQQQLSLGHNLPLGAYLLKPVQRVLKYHLLLHNILKNFDKSDPKYVIVSEALDHMTMRAQHMNEMKRKHEHAVRVQEIQSTLEDYEGEDLTRLGELVLEGSFRTYGAKTSRHVFLFEKGVLIAKRKENAMLSCKIFIECSNLMLVESLPKEPLSFQVIPFDNPKGQHVLMARNMDQKRKWCQEIKRLILESYKGKIPEKVKGLVMQLGKSKTDDSPDTKKFHHLAPDYLERRQRMRRKSGGTLLTDILKPPRIRKAQKRAESVSPRTSPTLSRKFVSPANESPVSMDTKSMDDGDESSIGRADDLMSRNSTESDLASIVSLSSQVDFCQSPKANIGRSTSFRTAVRSRPLHSQSFEDSCPPSPVSKSPSSTPTRRSKSFKLATRFKPLLASETTSLPNSPSLPTAKIGFGGNSGSTPDFCDNESSDQVFSDELTTTCRPQQLSLSNSGKFSSMPVLSETEKARHRKSDISPKLSNGSFNFGNVMQSPKKVIDVRQYFNRNKENNPSISSLTDAKENQNLRKEAKSVSAFHDTFLRKSTENLQKSPKIVKKAITLTRPLSVKNVLNKAYSSDIARVPPATVEDPWIYNPNVASKENIPHSVHETEKNSYSSGKHRHQRTRSYGGELDDHPNGNFDWIVYANRNSLPVTGLSSEEMHRFQNYYSQSRDSSASYQSSVGKMSYESPAVTEKEQDHSVHFCGDSDKEPSNSVNTYSEDRQQNKDFHTLSNRTLSNELSALGSLPMVNKPPDSCVVQCRKQVKVTRSNSTPCTRPDKYLVFSRYNRTQSVDVTGLDDPDQLLAEMEDYMKRSNSTITLTSQRFPTRFAMPSEDVKEEQESETNRDSYVSTVSSSSYESQESSDNQESDGLVETLKHKFQDFRKKMYRRSGSYDNKNASGSELDNDSDADQQVKTRNTESKSSLWSLNSWFSPKKDSTLPDLSTVLHAGDLGGAGIGSRMADPDPIYAEIGLTQSRYSTDVTQSPTKHDSCVLGTNTVSVSVKAETLPRDYHNGTLDRNLNYQQCDSAFSIDVGDSSSTGTSEESPRMAACVEQRALPGPPTLKKADSFYEKRLSMAFNDSEFFRDSAVYCDVDLDNQPLSPSTSTPTEVKPPRLPIKAYVQKLEEQHRQKFPATTKVKVREPGEVIKQRLESLQHYSQRRSQSCSRPGSEEREFSRRSSSSSRSVSVDREVTPHRFSLVNFDHNFEDAVDKSRGELFRSYGRENSEPDFRGRSRSRSKSPGGTLKSASSMGRLDQLSTDVENLFIMKGWVKQLIDKFQPPSNT